MTPSFLEACVWLMMWLRSTLEEFVQPFFFFVHKVAKVSKWHARFNTTQKREFVTAALRGISLSCKETASKQKKHHCIATEPIATTEGMTGRKREDEKKKV